MEFSVALPEFAFMRFHRLISTAAAALWLCSGSVSAQTHKAEGNTSGITLASTSLKAKALFDRLDQNGDGLLNLDEMPAALRAELDKWDANKDGLIDFPEFLAYFNARQSEGRPNDAGSFRLAAGAGSRSNAERTAPLPVGLPDWFNTLDTDHDMQIGLYEWKASGRPVAEFLKMDRNNDGFLTPQEVQSYVSSSRPSVLRPKSGVAGPTPGSTPAPSSVSATNSTSPPAATPAAVPLSIPPTASTEQEVPDTASTALPLNDGTNAYWMAREAQNEAQIALGHANVVFLGDSITDFMMTGLGEPVWTTIFEPLGADDLAVGGTTTSQVLWQVQVGQVAAVTPNVVVLLIGTNNLAGGQSPTSVAGGITAIVKEIKGQLPNTKILLLGILPRGQNFNDPLRQPIAQVNQLISQLDDGNQVKFLDIGSAFLERDATISTAVMPDYLHPSLLGYQIYTAAVLPTLQDLLRTGK
jgi:beta-glucosidase